MSLIKILHYADFQLEVRTSGGNAQRYDEYVRTLQIFETAVKEMMPDLVIIPGDVFEFQEANAEEQKIFSTHLHKILPCTKRIVLIPGNHDVRQRGVALDSLEKKRNLTDMIDSTVVAINSPKISYYQRTGLYKDSVFDITWAVWSQWDKHSMEEPKPAYSPWENHSKDDVKTSALIELFHDPIRGCKDFDGQPSVTFSNYKITLEDFQAKTIIAGDIHAPEIIWFGEDKQRLFTYSSSLVQRHFGEGDYYRDLDKYISGNEKHGYNVIEFNIEMDQAESCEFFQLAPIVSRHTIYLTERFNYDTLIPALGIDSTEFNHIRLVCQGQLKSFVENEQQLIQHFKSKYHCTIDIDYARDVIEVDIDENEFQDLSQLIDKEKMLKISKKYIATIVDKTKTISTEDKAETEAYIYQLFESQLNDTDLATNRVDIQILRARVHGFMSLGGDSTVAFPDKPLTVISGTNGIGKTNIHNFFRWIFTDKISPYQNDRNKKFNYAMYFNDSSEEDVVFGSTDFLVNGVIHKMTKTLTRTWKKGTKDIHNPDWIDNLAGTPKMELSIQSANFTSSSTEEAVEYLSNLITFTELNRLVFVDRMSLNSLINTKSEDLSAQFLTTVGLDIMNSILETYDTIKEERLSRLPKPTITVEKAIEKIALTDQMNKSIDEEKQQLDESSKILKSSIQKQQNEANRLRSTLHQVPTEDKITILIQDLDETIAETTDTNTKITDEILALEEAKKVDVNELKDQKHAIELDLNKSKSDVEKFNRETEILEEKIELSNKNMLSIAKEVKSEIDAEIQEVKLKESNVSTEIGRLETKLLENRQQYEKALQNKKSTITGIIDNLNLEAKEISAKKTKSEMNIAKIDNFIETTTDKVATIQDEIEKLSNDTKCPACGSEKNEEALHEIANTIVSKETVIGEHTTNLEKINAKKLDIQQLMKTHDDELKAVESNIDEQNKSILILNALIDSEEIDSDYPEFISNLQEIQEAHATKTDQLTKLRQEIEDFNTTVNDRLKDDERVSAAIQDKSDAKSKLSAHIAIEELVTSQVDEHSAKMKAIILQIEEALKIDTKIKTLTEEKNTNTENQVENVLELNKLKEQLPLAKLNKKTNEEIKIVDASIKSNEDEIDKLVSRQSELANQKLKNTEQSEKLQQEIEDIRKYKLIESSLKLYKRLLGKTGLPQYIFAHLIPLINQKLNDSLEGVDFRLMFSPGSGELRFIDLKRNISRPVQFISGMQETVVGLALVNILRILNNSKTFNILMVDEISGTLNNGDKLTYKAKNYQKLVKNFLYTLAENVNIYIIDHLLDFEGARVIEVRPTADGNTIVELT